MTPDQSSQTVPPEEMHRLGLLVRHVGHDFNNFLSSILGYASLLKSKTDRDDPCFRYATMIETAANEASALAERLLFFGRLWTAPPAKIPIDLAAAQEEVVRTLMGGMGAPRADVCAERVEAKGRMSLDLRQMQRAVEALGCNACEAQPSAPTPRIAVRFRIIAREDLPGEPLALPPSGRWLEIAVSDQGRGMDAEVLAQAFRPGFTTQSGARRQGLGLPLALGFAHAHAGLMDLRSRPGEGTTATLWLPVDEIG